MQAAGMSGDDLGDEEGGPMIGYAMVMVRPQCRQQSPHYDHDESHDDQ
jgi:hypothetical protein